jgi:hypothetical protein
VAFFPAWVLSSACRDVRHPQDDQQMPTRLPGSLCDPVRLDVAETAMQKYVIQDYQKGFEEDQVRIGVEI